MEGFRASRILSVGAIAIAFLLGSHAEAAPFTVQDLGIKGAVVKVSIPGFYKGKVLAGLNQLVVNGVAMDGFCIDPFHPSLPSSPGYNFLDLQSAPKAPGTMNAAAAEKICDLWTMFYSPLMTNQQAAGLQVAIWEIVGGSNFLVRGKDYGASALLQQLQTFTGGHVNLIAVSGPGQDYAVLSPFSNQETLPTQTVPETGSSLLWLASVVATIAIAQLKARLVFRSRAEVSGHRRLFAAG